MVEKMFKRTLLLQIFARSTGIFGMLIDGIIISTCFGLDAMAAYGFVSPVNVIFGAIAGTFGVGVSVLCSKCVGSGDIQKTNSIVTSSICIVLILSLISILITSLFSYDIAGMLGAHGKIRELSAEYIQTLGLCLPARSILSILIPVVQLDGDKIRVAVGIVLMTIVNIVLDLLNGYVIHYGLWGMGLCSSASYYVAFLILILHFARKEKMISLDFKSIKLIHGKGILVFGFPYALQQICRTGLTLTLNLLINYYFGTHYVAIFAAIMATTNFCATLGDGIGSTVSMISGVYLGEKNRLAIKKLLKVSGKYSIIINGITSIIVIIFARTIMLSFFSPNTWVLDEAILGIRIVATSFIIYSFNSTFRFYLQTIRQLILTYIFSLIGCYFSVALLSYFMSQFLGVTGIWLAFPLGEILTLAVLIIVATIRKHGFINSVDDIMFLPKDFDDEIQLENTFRITNKSQITLVSEKIRQFCLQNKISDENSMWISLFSEEMSAKIIEFGFTDGKKHSIEIRVSRYASKWIIRFRDDCFIFNPMQYMTIKDPLDDLSQIGIKIVSERAKQVDYFNTLKLNNLIIVFSE